MKNTVSQITGEVERCEYCQKHFAKPIHDNELEETSVAVMHYKTLDDSIAVLIEVYCGDGYVSVDINYCPMCGKKLVSI